MAINRSGKMNQQNRGSKSNNFETNTKTEDLALAEAMYLTPAEETKVEDIPVEEINNALVYENGVTSIDFMMPEEERKIIENNINKYSDMTKLKKVLNVAKQNKVLSEEIETLNLIAKTDKLTNQIFDVMTSPENIQKLNEYIQQKLEAGDVAKAYKEIGLMNKAMLDARDGMINKLRTNDSGKKSRVVLKFTNNDGQDFQLGAEING